VNALQKKEQLWLFVGWRSSSEEQQQRGAAAARSNNSEEQQQRGAAAASSSSSSSDEQQQRGAATASSSPSGRALPRRGCCSACTAAQLKGGFVDVDVKERVLALCAVVECFLAVEGKAPTVTRLLETGSKDYRTDWTGGKGSWSRKKTRAFLIYSLIGLRHLRVLRFAPDTADDPATADQTRFPSAPVAVNSDILDGYVRTEQPMTIRFPKSLAPKLH
jgi:hypothetical protein